MCKKSQRNAEAREENIRFITFLLPPSVTPRYPFATPSRPLKAPPVPPIFPVTEISGQLGFEPPTSLCVLIIPPHLDHYAIKGKEQQCISEC